MSCTVCRILTMLYFVLYRMPYFDRWVEEKLRHAGTITFLAESPEFQLLGVGFCILHSK